MTQRVGSNAVRNEEGVISIPALDYIPDSRGLGCLIFDKMVENKEYLAQTDGITGQKDSYESLHQRCIRTAIAMRSKGIRSEDIISICSYNHLNTCVPYIAALFIGAKIACLDPALGLSDTIHMIKLVRPKLIFTGPEATRLIDDAVRESRIQTQIVIFGTSSIYEEFSEFLILNTQEESFVPTSIANIQDTAIIFFSAGTTGMPKGVCMSHRALLAQIHQVSGSRSIHAPSSKYFVSQIIFSSLYWISSISVLLTCIFFKRSRVVFPRFDVNSIWSLLETTKVNVVLLAPSQVQQLCIKGKPKGTDTSHLMQVTVTGASISKQQILELRQLLPGVDIINLYGLTEAGGYLLSLRPHVYPEEKRLLLEKVNSCGRPRPGIFCKVVDSETGEILGPHQWGELRVKSRFQMSGYFGIDSTNCWDADGWLKTADEVYYDEDKCFFIVDRIKDMLKFKSWYIAPAKLEGVLHSHPAVETAVVVGLPHPEDGEHAVGVVVLRPYAVGTISAEDIVYYVDERVDDKHKLRGGVRIVEHIPMTPTGKNKRRDMRDLVLQGQI